MGSETHVAASDEAAHSQIIVADQKSGADKMLWGGPWQVAEVGQEKQNRMGGGEQEKGVKEVSMCVFVCKYVCVCV